jgi:hypothetical protein
MNVLNAVGLARHRLEIYSLPHLNGGHAGNLCQLGVFKLIAPRLNVVGKEANGLLLPENNLKTRAQQPEEYEDEEGQREMIE